MRTISHSLRLFGVHGGFEQLAALSFYLANENLLILGKTGEGKSHLAIAIGQRLCSESVSAVFLPANFLFEDVLAAKAAGKYLAYVKRLTQTKEIVLDDFGLRNYTHE